MSAVFHFTLPEEIKVEVLITVIVEVRSLAVAIGVATSVANALVNPAAPITKLETLLQHSPVLSFEFIEALNYIRGLNESSAVSRSLWQLMTKLRRAKVATVEVALNSASPFGIPASKFVQTAVSWSASCRTAIDAIHGLKQISQHYNIEICASPTWSSIVAFLEAAADGNHACVKDTGEIARPDWADRRQMDCIPIMSHAILSRGNSATEVVLRDISEMGAGFGLGLDGTVTVDPGDKVSVQLECGGILSGRVMWASEGRAAIEVMKCYRA